MLQARQSLAVSKRFCEDGICQRSAGSESDMEGVEAAASVCH